METDSHNLKQTSPHNWSATAVPVHQVCHCWLVQQWNPGTSAALLGKPAVAPTSIPLAVGIETFSFNPEPAATALCEKCSRRRWLRVKRISRTRVRYKSRIRNRRRFVAEIPRGRFGYSYIELTVVLLICSMLGAAAIPRYTNALFQLRVDAAAKRVAADITYLQRQSLYRSASQSIVFTPNGGSGTPNSYSMPTVQYVDFAAAGKVVNLSQEPFNATIVSASFQGSQTLTFDRYGVPSNGGTVVVASGGYQKTVQVDSSTGDVTIP